MRVATGVGEAPVRPRRVQNWDIELAAAAAPNTRGHVWQDRWSVGRNHRGGWLVLADGIGGGEHGEQAAEAAVRVAAGHLSTSELDEAAVMSCMVLAQAAVSPWYVRSGGGCTLSVAALTPARVVAASVGDSPVLVPHEGRWHQVSPVLTGPLRAWIGDVEAFTPWLDSWAVEEMPGIALCSDGVLARDTLVDGIGPNAWAEAMLAQHTSADGDDATVVAARVRNRW